MSDIPINLVFEDILSEVVLRKILRESQQTYAIGISYNGRGVGWIKKRIGGFNNAAKGMAYLVLVDLDVEECPPVLINEWLNVTRHHNLLLRVAVREVEAWVMGCRTAFAKFLGINTERIPTNVDEIEDTKKFLIDLVRRSRKRQLRSDIVPRKGSTAKIGPDYNGRLIEFVEKYWDPYIAQEFSPSLQRTIRLLDSFQPIYQTEV